MRALFERVNDVSPPLLTAYLRARGWSPDLIRWKYFDDRFNRDRTRGFAWIHDNQVQGLIGMIPGRLATGDRSWPVYWACDWSVESPDATPGIGVFLFQKAVQNAATYLASGGNENSLKYFPRLAKQTMAGAAVDYHIPIRLEALLEPLGRKAPALRLDRWPVIGNLTVPRLGLTNRRVKTRTEPGVPAAIEPVLSALGSDSLRPAYDLEHVQWLVGRCPLITSLTTVDTARKHPGAAVIAWRHQASARRWRGVLLSGPGEEPELLEACLAETVRIISARGGSRFTVMASRGDEVIGGILKSQGAIMGRKTDLFVFRNDADLKIGAPEGLSLLESDYPVLA